MNTVYVAWGNPKTTTWHPIGLLRELNGVFSFEYLAGVRDAKGFEPLKEFPDLNTRYESTSLFPIFDNRLMVRGRPDYPIYLQWLGLEKSQDGPLAELAASGGRRMADSFEVFSVPSRNQNNRYQSVFFLHGLRHQSDVAKTLIGKLRVADELQLEHEKSNQFDPCAHKVKLNNVQIGYVPRYLSRDITALNINQSAKITVEAINAEAPLSHKVLCRVSAPWPIDFEPLSAPEFQPIRLATHQ